MKDRERDILRKTILELLTKGCMHYTDLDKKVCTTCHPFACARVERSGFCSSCRRVKSGLDKTLARRG